MATKNSKPITKKQLLIEIDDKIQSLNLLKSALQGIHHENKMTLKIIEGDFMNWLMIRKKSNSTNLKQF